MIFSPPSVPFNRALSSTSRRGRSTTLGKGPSHLIHSPLFRLYFLSNNELLEMLAKTKNPLAVEPYLNKLFSSVTRLEFNTKGEISAVYSEGGEKLKLVKAVNVHLTKVRKSGSGGVGAVL